MSGPTLPEGIDGDFIVLVDDSGVSLPFEVQDAEGEFVCRCASREIADRIKAALNLLPSCGEDE